MDRTEFLTKMFRMYPNSFNEFNIADWMEAYKAVLSDSRIDYERLFQTMIRKWNSTTIAPHPSWFDENVSTSIVKDERSAVMRHLEEIKETAVPMPEDFKIKMEALKQKLSMG